jgi:TctA family transporter
MPAKWLILSDGGMSISRLRPISAALIAAFLMLVVVPLFMKNRHPQGMSQEREG